VLMLLFGLLSFGTNVPETGIMFEDVVAVELVAVRRIC
jgi:hypothetical protein